MEQILVTFGCWQVFVLVICRTAEKRPGCLVYVAGKVLRVCAFSLRVTGEPTQFGIDILRSKVW